MLETEFDHEEARIAAGTMRRYQPEPPLPLDQPATSAPRRFSIEWVDKFREARWPANPTYPQGTAIDVTLGDEPKAGVCRVFLPYPAARCGMWVVVCKRCDRTFGTTGQADDPVSVRMPCKQVLAGAGAGPDFERRLTPPPVPAPA